VKLCGSLIVVALAFAVPSTGRVAAQTPFIAYLDGAGQDPPNDSLASGFAVVTVDLALHTMRMQVRFENLTGAATAGGIYGVTTQQGEGTTRSATPLPAFNGFPLGQNSGEFDLTFSFDEPTSFNPEYLAAHGGIFEAPTVLAFGIGDGKAYVNIPSAAYPDGEIRGFLLAAQAADFNLNGLVDAPDLAVWRSEYGSISGVADATRDLLADGSDFLAWQRQVGLQAALGGGLGHHVQAIPEPSMAVLGGFLASVAAWLARTDIRRRWTLRKSARTRHTPRKTVRTPACETFAGIQPGIELPPSPRSVMMTGA
jgi:hypothetical protein